MSKIEKTIARQQQKYVRTLRQPCHVHTFANASRRIAEGQYYEAHQQLRVIASRYVKQSAWSSAIDILYSGALSLLKAGQGGSGGDLCLFLVEVYNKGEIKSDAASKNKVLSLLRAFPKDDPVRKRFLGEAVGYVLWRKLGARAEREAVVGSRCKRDVMQDAC